MVDKAARCLKVQYLSRIIWKEWGTPRQCSVSLVGIGGASNRVPPEKVLDAL